MINKEKEYNKLRTEAYKLRDKIIEEREEKCEKCFKNFKKPYNREAILHHKIKIEEGGNNNLDNLLVLCCSCHAKIHPERGLRFEKVRIRNRKAKS